MALALLVAAGVLAAVLATRGHHSASPPQTVVHTVTQPGTTVRETVTTGPQTTTAAPPSSSASGQALNNEGYAKMQVGDYNGALPLLQQAVQKLDGSGVIDEAYAKYNLAYTRYALGDCTDVLALLDQAQAIEGHRSAINQLRSRAKKSC